MMVNELSAANLVLLLLHTVPDADTTFHTDVISYAKDFKDIDNKLNKLKAKYVIAYLFETPKKYSYIKRHRKKHDLITEFLDKNAHYQAGEGLALARKQRLYTRIIRRIQSALIETHQYYQSYPETAQHPYGL